MNNEIPPMTDPLGRHWEQPCRSRILIDGTHALMERATFDGLAEYSSSIPSGVYVGKMWKRHQGIFNETFLAKGGKPVWQLFWFGEHPDVDMVSVHFREIIILD